MNIKSIIDCHVHSKNSYDSKELIKEYCQEAVKRGLAGIIITDHLDMDPDDISYGYYNYQNISSEIEESKRDYPELLLLHGVEITYQNEYHQEIKNIVNQFEYDFVIGSIHIVNIYGKKYFIDLPQIKNEFGVLSMELFVEAYYNEMKKLIDSSLFDTIGHFDVLRRYSPKNINITEISRSYYKKCLQKIIKRNIGLELNTSSIRHGLSDFYPTREILEKYFVEGGKIVTLGSDSHNKSTLGNHFSESINILREIGFESLSYYSNRKRIEMKI